MRLPSPIVPALAMFLLGVALAILTLFAGEAEAADNYSAPKCGGGSVLLSADEKGVFSLQNEARRKRGLKALCIHPDLQKAARFHSQEEIDNDYMDHDSFDGVRFYETSRQRLQRFGYTPQGFSTYYIGENIYYGSEGLGEPQDAVTWWMNSPGHRANILNKNFRQVGIGAVSGEYKGSSGYTAYTVDFGMRR